MSAHRSPIGAKPICESTTPGGSCSTGSSPTPSCPLPISRARELLDATSPKDRQWLKLPFGAEWAESDKRLKRIDAEGLARDVDALAGPEFLVEVRSAHEAYGMALGITKPSEEVAAVKLAEPLRTLSRAIARYGLAVAAIVDDDEASVAMARRALRPIDDHRDGQARRSSGGAVAPAPGTTPPTTTTPPVTPTTPVPEVP
jgi:hypothetical protein